MTLLTKKLVFSAPTPPSGNGKSSRQFGHEIALMYLSGYFFAKLSAQVVRYFKQNVWRHGKAFGSSMTAKQIPHCTRSAFEGSVSLQSFESAILSV